MTDDEVPAAERAPYENAALQIVRAIVAERFPEAYGSFAPQAKQALPEADFVSGMAQLMQLWKPIQDLHVAYSYRLTQATVGNAQTMAMCTTVAHGSIVEPQGRVLAAELPVKLQAHVVVEGTTKNNRVGFVLWLVPAVPDWQVLRLEMMPVTILEKSASDVLAMARVQSARNHAFSAYLLYVAASQLAYRGPAFHLAIQDEIGKELKALQRPADLASDPPFSWRFGDTIYRVVSLGPLGVANNFALMIRHELPGNPSNAEVERQNRALIDGFRAAHPEYSDSFDALVVQAVFDDGRRLFGTVEQTKPR